MDSLLSPHDYIRLPFGTGFSGKAMLVIMNVVFGLPAVMTWAAFGTVLRGLHYSSFGYLAKPRDGVSCLLSHFG